MGAVEKVSETSSMERERLYSQFLCCGLLLAALRLLRCCVLLCCAVLCWAWL